MNALVMRMGGPALMRSLAGPVLVMLILAMMILPLPPLLLDLFFTFNIAFAVMVLLTAMYTVNATQAPMTTHFQSARVVRRDSTSLAPPGVNVSGVVVVVVLMVALAAPLGRVRGVMMMSAVVVMPVRRPRVCAED